jgi:hypothetical protein
MIYRGYVTALLLLILTIVQSAVRFYFERLLNEIMKLAISL